MSVRHELQIAGGDTGRVCCLCSLEDGNHWLQVLARDVLADGTPVARMTSSHARAVCSRCVRALVTGSWNANT